MNKILFFAHLRDVVGKDYVEMDVKGQTVAQFKQTIAEMYAIQNFDQVMTAINEEFSANDDRIQEGDTIAFIPPVSGG
jgi:sulfur-carrier protein